MSEQLLPRYVGFTGLIVIMAIGLALVGVGLYCTALPCDALCKRLPALPSHDCAERAPVSTRTENPRQQTWDEFVESLQPKRRPQPPPACEPDPQRRKVWI